MSTVDDERESDHAWEIKDLLRSGQIAEAKRVAAELLRSGANEQDFLQIVAYLLDPPVPLKRGRPRGSPIWRQSPRVGDDFSRLRAEGLSYDDAIDALASKYRRGRRTVEAVVEYDRAQMKAYEEDRLEQERWYAGLSDEEKARYDARWEEAELEQERWYASLSDEEKERYHASWAELNAEDRDA